LLYISHDRYFINSTAEKIIELTPTGAEVYAGNYNYYLEKKMGKLKPASAENLPPLKYEYSEKRNRSEERRQAARLAKLETEIAETETRVKELDELLSKPEIGSNAQKAHEIYLEKQNAEESLSALYEEWGNYFG